MPVIREDLSRALHRWREVIAGGGVLLVGLWWGWRSFGLVQGIGWALALIGAGLVWAAVQRLRFNRGGGGIGVVQVDERRIAYFGPLTGGIIDLDDLLTLDLDPTGYPVAHWLLSGIGGSHVEIPVDAEGADSLFDLFSSLPGLRTEQMLDALSRSPKTRLRLWERNRPRLH